uniref:Transmembrane protein n=1 Tax=Cacopsylla melanoneura TaxID=428564 RepID=A0A8D9E3E3_9HEMI
MQEEFKRTEENFDEKCVYFLSYFMMKKYEGNLIIFHQIFFFYLEFLLIFSLSSFQFGILKQGPALRPFHYLLLVVFSLYFIFQILYFTSANIMQSLEFPQCLQNI